MAQLDSSLLIADKEIEKKMVTRSVPDEQFSGVCNSIFPRLAICYNLVKTTRANLTVLMSG